MNFHMPPWQAMWLLWKQCYTSYRAEILFADLTSVECHYYKYSHPLPKIHYNIISHYGMKYQPIKVLKVAFEK